MKRREQEPEQRKNRTLLVIYVILSSLSSIAALAGGFFATQTMIYDEDSPLNCIGSQCSVSLFIMLKAVSQLILPLILSVIFLVCVMLKKRELVEHGQLDKDVQFYIGLSYTFFVAMLIGIIIALVYTFVVAR